LIVIALLTWRIPPKTPVRHRMMKLSQANRVTALASLRSITPGAEGGGSQPHLFETTAGQFMVKVANNPQGTRVLVNELIAGLAWIG
jgi:hypothetical protein